MATSSIVGLNPDVIGRIPSVLERCRIIAQRRIRNRQTPPTKARPSNGPKAVPILGAKAKTCPVAEEISMEPSMAAARKNAEILAARHDSLMAAPSTPSAPRTPDFSPSAPVASTGSRP